MTHNNAKHELGLSAGGDMSGSLNAVSKVATLEVQKLNGIPILDSTPGDGYVLYFRRINNRFEALAPGQRFEWSDGKTILSAVSYLRNEGNPFYAPTGVADPTYGGAPYTHLHHAVNGPIDGNGDGYSIYLNSAWHQDVYPGAINKLVFLNSAARFRTCSGTTINGHDGYVAWPNPGVVLGVPQYPASDGYMERGYTSGTLAITPGVMLSYDGTNWVEIGFFGGSL